MIHGLPGEQFLGKHIHSLKQSQLEKKTEEIQVLEHQRAGLLHPVANPLEMCRHLGPVKTGTMVMAKMITFIHEVDLVHDGHGICKIVVGTFWVTESVLNPCGNGIDKIHAKKRN